MSTVRFFKQGGMGWISLQKRLAIYKRDDFDCVWCRGWFATDELGYGLSLDHLHDRHDHRAENLVTCCPECNSRRSGLSLRRWITTLAADGHESAQTIRARVAAAASRPIDLQEGKRLALLRRPKIDLSGNRARAKRRKKPSVLRDAVALATVDDGGSREVAGTG